MICKLRKMEEKDLGVTFKWRNDTTIRNMAMSDNEISYAEHEAVFKFNNSYKLIFEVDGIPCGFVSCTINEEFDRLTGEWAFHLAPEARKKGYSEIMLKMAIILFRDEGYSLIQAAIKPENEISLNLHSKLGFDEVHFDNERFRKFELIL